MSLIVQKYGGTSVKDTERVKAVAQHVKKTKDAGNDVIVIVSAPAGMTDDLVRRADEITKLPSPREMDMLLSTGEQISISLLAMALQEIGEKAISLTGSQVEILTDEAHTKARILSINADRVNQEIKEGKIVIIAGFQGRTKDYEITTLGRGGSDTTAVAVAAAVNADLCEIYTDVDGIYTADPRIVKNPSKLETITYDEMIELASLGAKVLHPRSVEVAKLHDVKLSVRSSYDTDLGGTYVVERNELEKEFAVTGIACDKNVARVGIFDVPDSPGIAAGVFHALAEEKINIDMIIQSIMVDGKNDIAFTIPKNELNRAKLIIDGLKDSVGYSVATYEENIVKVSAVGAGMVSSHGIAARMFTTLSKEGINIESICTSEIKISCLIKNENNNMEVAMKALHDTFQLDKINA